MRRKGRGGIERAPWGRLPPTTRSRVPAKAGTREAGGVPDCSQEHGQEMAAVSEGISRNLPMRSNSTDMV